MDADEVKALVAAKWPHAMQSPLAQAVQQWTAADGAARAVGFARLQAICSTAHQRELVERAMEHARACLRARDGWTTETLGHNIESAFGAELDAADCDTIAAQAMGEQRRAAGESGG